jgi:general secretion pathway protein B
MSFILDALKKSESDRQRQSGPSLFEVKVAPPRTRLPIWAVAIAVLLGINVIVVSWMLLRHPTAARPAAASAAPAVPPARTLAAAAASGETVPMAVPGDTARAPAPSSSVPLSEGPDLVSGRSSASDSHPATPSQAVAAPAAGDADQSAAQPPAAGNPSDYAPAVEPAAAPGSGAAEGATGGLPLYQQIVTSDGLPPLHLDLHVFAQRPQDRFVMINMHRLGEGDSLPSGVHVDAIRPDGVVLSYHGLRFLLPRG